MIRVICIGFGLGRLIAIDRAIMGSKTTGSLLLLGNSQVTRELATVLSRLDLHVTFVASPREAMTFLQKDAPDLLLVEMTALRFTDIGLADLADAAHELGTRIALLTARSVVETAACASLIGAIATLNKWVSVRVTAERVNALVTHALCARNLGVVFDPGMPWAENDDEMVALVG
jgi:DNA-binding NtrC family response regulator